MTNLNLALVLLVMLLRAVQDPSERNDLSGRVVDRQGKPWADAKVILSSRGIDDVSGFGEAEKLVVATDAEGRFVVKLLPCRLYSAWAMSDLGKKRYRATQYYERVSAGQVLELREDGVFEQTRFVVHGLAEHKGVGPFQIQITRPGNPSLIEIVPTRRDLRTLIQSPGARLQQRASLTLTATRRVA